MIEQELLSAEQCREVQAIAAMCERRKIGSAAGAASRSKQLDFIDVPEWLASLLRGAFARAAAAMGYQAEPVLHMTADGCRPRVATYTVGSHFLWHTDIHQHEGNAVEWISCTTQLSAGAEYDGGDLEIIDEAHPDQVKPGSAEALAGLARRARATRQLGHAVTFPSQWPHQVTAVTRGCRQSLVCWANVARAQSDKAIDEQVLLDVARWQRARLSSA
ncbi:MAG: 2OG-Fe(II) oxygenase [Caldimonas sp.]